MFVCPVLVLLSKSTSLGNAERMMCYHVPRHHSGEEGEDLRPSTAMRDIHVR